ncbi:uncharacterized protein isoform X2 [Musca autumnalis]|uniref:uncharacterized protein isoform X2 n=1 Tax=Musca autumnalis TaxID=221902 RepID=UPI003CF8780C
MTSSSSFNKITFNCDVMIHIYKFLNIGDQLRLAQVDENQRSIFLQFVSPVKYKKFKVIQFEGDYIVSDDTDTDRILLRNSRDLEEFLQFYGNNVYEFLVRVKLNDRNFSELFENTSPRMEFFKNLVKFKIYCRRITVDDIVKVVNNMPNLEELQLHAVIIETEQSNGCITRAIVKELLRLQSPLHLKQLKIITKAPFSLKGSTSLVPMLNSFRNLNILDIDHFCNEMVIVLESLTQLHQLTLRSTDFSEEPSVILPPNITTLHLIDCVGILLEHIQQFLHENLNPKLIEFVAIKTYFRVKEFKELHISSRIKTLNIGSFDLNQFRSPFVENSALENLNLGTFHAKNLTMNTLHNLKNLKMLSLQITLPDEGFYVIRILQELPLLRELVVRHATSSWPSLRAVVTSVTSLKILSFQNSDTILGFWFDMFSLNPKLELQLRLNTDDPNRLQFLIEHENFPRNLRKIEVCGFTVDFYLSCIFPDCNKLRKNFKSVLKTINYNIDDYEPLYHLERKCNIIMSRYKK